MNTNPEDLKAIVEGRLAHADALGLCARERAATELALRCLENATSQWTDDCERELEEELLTCDWFHPQLAALVRCIIREADEAI